MDLYHITLVVVLLAALPFALATVTSALAIITRVCKFLVTNVQAVAGLGLLAYCLGPFLLAVLFGLVVGPVLFVAVEIYQSLSKQAPTSLIDLALAASVAVSAYCINWIFVIEARESNEKRRLRRESRKFSVALMGVVCSAITVYLMATAYKPIVDSLYIYERTIDNPSNLQTLLQAQFIASCLYAVVLAGFVLIVQVFRRLGLTESVPVQKSVSSEA